MPDLSLHPWHMRNSLFLLLLLLGTLQLNRCLGDDWIYGTWYFDANSSGKQLTNYNATLPKPTDRHALAMFNAFPGAMIKVMKGSKYVFTTNTVTVTLSGVSYTQSFRILSRPNTNQIDFKFGSGYTNTYLLTNGLLEVNGIRPGMKFYYSRRSKR